ncbi:MAG: alpha-L-arabinofuranosidase [Firmicutes bacterium]|nr:alpha-L-arabinofuranosidase [Bacillota bacterium]
MPEQNAKSKIRVNAEKKLHPTGDLYGIFFEDINHAADGGLYAETVRNRSFEFDPIDNDSYTPTTAWEFIGRDGGEVSAKVESVYPLNVNNTHYLRIKNRAHEGSHNDGTYKTVGTVGAVNLGYNTGIPLYAGAEYKFSMFARRDICLSSPVEIRLESVSGELYGRAEIVISSTEWTKYEASIVSSAEDFSGRLVVLVHGGGDVCLDMVSLFPKNTFHGRENGLRPDIAGFLEALKPKFMRFPGGCLTHDGSLDIHARDSMYRWKNSLGALEERPSKKNNWRYNQTYGFGYYEFFLFCEDIGTKPLPVLPGAFNPHRQDAVPLEEMQAWVDDALELLEFANGDEKTTKWGAYRAKLGHPAPFGVEYIAVGNEENDEAFFERYPYFHRTIAEKYPNVKILNTAGPWESGKGFDLGWESSRENGSYGVDEHYYVSPDWLIKHYDRYYSDFYDEKGPKVFLGEYASRGNTFYNALCEAAYMTSFENNADVVALTCYAPLLCNADYVNWRPNLIWYNNHEIFGIPSYYVQKMYSVNQGDVTLENSAEITPEDEAAEPERISGGFTFGVGPGAATFDSIKINGVTPSATDVEVLLGDWSYSDGKLKKSPEPTPEGEGAAAPPPRRRFGSPDVKLNGDYEDFTFECTVKLEERTFEFPDRPGERHRHGFHIGFCRGEGTGFSLHIGGFRGNEAFLSYEARGYDDRFASAPIKADLDDEIALKIEREGCRITYSLNGEVVQSVEYAPTAPRRIYVSSTYDEASDEVIIKAVNVRETPVTLEIDVSGVGEEGRTVKLETLTAASLDDTNTFEEPRKVATAASEFDVPSVPFTYDFPAHSVNIFRIPVRADK